MKRRIASRIARPIGLLALTSTLVLGGCDDGFGPQIWGNFPDTVELYSLARPDHVGLPSAYNMAGLNPVVVDQPKRNPADFDFAVTENDEGEFLLLPAGVFANFSIRPGIQVDSTATFDELSRAPRDGYTFEEPVVADSNTVYVVRSRQASNGCFFYGKIEVLELDPEGSVTIQALANPNCSDRSLTPNAPPPEEDDDGEGDGEG